MNKVTLAEHLKKARAARDPKRLKEVARENGKKGGRPKKTKEQ